MEELTNRISAKADIAADTAEQAIAIILEFLKKEGGEEKMQQIFDALPGAQALVEAREQAKSGGGLLGGLGNMMGGMMGAMATLNELKGVGLDMGEIQSVVKELISYAKEKAGDEVVDDVVSQIPGLSQII
ncbi:DUF2267 domain-containing protein [Roseibium denhamense]|uniref:DUF2267 domain-containing protein n=1 Tax=Roseibium denhamense TaxID=76305 RepID=A0ABY1N6K3_9HYPH|nr:DUF2780 domain-containing protein [Roseibium denhamense]MTI06085.1 DUF2267 domain-containing protein [Roseibium denhamense]SMP01230.1 Protein of unknown function VcgC/VcgE [Roseibium denhamense]